MLELKELTKIYQTKGGTETRALDGVSVSFGETGLVFLLGKSGSGKSTMLNLAGGLDEPTSGEIVVMGKSLKSFSGSDFDSYRNTFVGFVFQEYNVLDEFTVEENVALALELQGNAKGGDRVRRILDEVELGEVAGRKPNTLSGGQKQRVAIARALVKEPKIILADEPTGALDSETGGQVFETVKELSKTRLVIVVSHDREFAETYGDRIIELKDGKIISDVSKAGLSSEFAEKQEAVLDEKLFDKIRTFLARDDKKTYKEFLQANGDVAGIATFETTPPQALKEYDESEVKFIRSRLPFRNAVKIGASGLKLKPFRLALTILLSVIAFVMFGLLSTMMFFDSGRVLAQSIKESGFEYVMEEKNHLSREFYNYGDIFERSNRARITPDDVAAHGESALGAYRLNISGQSNVGVSDSKYYRLSLRYVAVAPENHPFRGESFEGRYPTAATEIAVSSYFLEVLKNSTFTTVNEDGRLGRQKQIMQASDLIGERVFISSLEATFTVTGIFDSGAIPTRFETLKKFSYDTSYQRLLASYADYLNASVHSLLLVSDAFYTRFSSVIGDSTLSEVDYFGHCNSGYDFGVTLSGQTKELFGGSKSTLQPYSADPGARRRPITFFGEPKETLGENEVILPLYSIAVYYDFLAEELTSEAELREYEIFESACHALIYGRLTSVEEIEKNKTLILDYIAARPIETLTLFENGREKGTATVVGFYRTTYGYTYYSDGFYCSQAFYEGAHPYNTVRVETNYRPEATAAYDFILYPLGKSDADIFAFAKTLGEKNADPETDVFYSLDNPVYDNVEMANVLVNLLSTVFLWVGVVMAVFAALLLFNFISVSITSKKKEIGILRAVGARGTDVFKIFFSESGIIVGICIVLSVIGTIVLSAVLNSVIRTELALLISLFVFGPLSVVMMVGIAAVVAVLATFMPVYFAAKKKPVESIRAI